MTPSTILLPAAALLALAALGSLYLRWWSLAGLCGIGTVGIVVVGRWLDRRLG